MKKTRSEKSRDPVPLTYTILWVRACCLPIHITGEVRGNQKKDERFNSSMELSITYIKKCFICTVSSTYCISVSRMLIMYDAFTNVTTFVGSIHEGNTEEEITVTSSFNEMGNRMLVRGRDICSPTPTLFYSRLLE